MEYSPSRNTNRTLMTLGLIRKFIHKKLINKIGGFLIGNRVDTSRDSNRTDEKSVTDGRGLYDLDQRSGWEGRKARDGRLFLRLD